MFQTRQHTTKSTNSTKTYKFKQRQRKSLSCKRKSQQLTRENIRFLETLGFRVLVPATGEQKKKKKKKKKKIK